MRTNLLAAAFFVMAGAVSLVSCSDRSSRPGGGPGAKKARPVVYASTYPLQYFAERIAGEAAEVKGLTPVGEDAECYKPGAEEIKALQKADLILVNGAGLEKWLRKVMLPASRIVDTSKRFRDKYITLAETVTHSHGPEGAHTHEGVVVQTWLDPMLASVQAEEIARALSRLLPERENEFTMNVEQIKFELEKLDGAFMEAIMTGGQKRHFLFSHQVYEYFARRYELKATSLHIEPTGTPDDETFESTKRMLKTRPAEYIVWEFDPAEEIAKRFGEELGLKSVFFETCSTYTTEQAEAGMDYFAIMKRNIEQVRPVFAVEE